MSDKEKSFDEKMLMKIAWHTEQLLNKEEWIALLSAHADWRPNVGVENGEFLLEYIAGSLPKEIEHILSSVVDSGKIIPDDVLVKVGMNIIISGEENSWNSFAQWLDKNASKDFWQVASSVFLQTALENDSKSAIFNVLLDRGVNLNKAVVKKYLINNYRNEPLALPVLATFKDFEGFESVIRHPKAKIDWFFKFKEMGIPQWIDLLVSKGALSSKESTKMLKEIQLRQENEKKSLTENEKVKILWSEGKYAEKWTSLQRGLTLFSEEVKDLRGEFSENFLMYVARENKKLLARSLLAKPFKDSGYMQKDKNGLDVLHYLVLPPVGHSGLNIDANAIDSLERLKEVLPKNQEAWQFWLNDLVGVQLKVEHIDSSDYCIGGKYFWSGLRRVSDEIPSFEELYVNAVKGRECEILKKANNLLPLFNLEEDIRNNTKASQLIEKYKISTPGGASFMFASYKLSLFIELEKRTNSSYYFDKKYEPIKKELVLDTFRELINLGAKQEIVYQVPDLIKGKQQKALDRLSKISGAEDWIRGLESQLEAEFLKVHNGYSTPTQKRKIL